MQSVPLGSRVDILNIVDIRSIVWRTVTVFLLQGNLVSAWRWNDGSLTRGLKFKSFTDLKYVPAIISGIPWCAIVELHHKINVIVVLETRSIIAHTLCSFSSVSFTREK